MKICTLCLVVGLIVNATFSNPIVTTEVQKMLEKQTETLQGDWEYSNCRLLSEEIRLVLSPKLLRVIGRYDLYIPELERNINILFPGDYVDHAFSPSVNHEMFQFKAYVYAGDRESKRPINNVFRSRENERRIPDLVGDPNVNVKRWYSWKLRTLKDSMFGIKQSIYQYPEQQTFETDYKCFVSGPDSLTAAEGMLLYIFSKGSNWSDDFKSATVTLEFDGMDMNDIARFQPEPSTVLPDRTVLWYFTNLNSPRDKNIRVWFKPKI